MREHDAAAIVGGAQVKLLSSSNSLVSVFLKNQPVVGGWSGSSPALAFRNRYSFCSTTHSSFDLMQKCENISSILKKSHSPEEQSRVVLLWHLSRMDLFENRALVSFLSNEKFKQTHCAALMIASRPGG